MTILLLTVGFVVITYCFGLLYAVISRAIKKAVIAAAGWTGFCVIGIIGVPFHELSHLITALIFNHDVTDFALFRPIQGRDDGQLGYVNHSYNKRSLYQSLGNFFIGTAPMLFGAGLLTFLLYIAIPDRFDINTPLSADYIGTLALALWGKLKNGDVVCIVMLIVAMLICPHLGISGADLKNSLSGVIFLLAASIIVPYELNAHLGISYSLMNIAIYDFLARYACCLFIGSMISIIVLIINKLLGTKV